VFVTSMVYIPPTSSPDLTVTAPTPLTDQATPTPPGNSASMATFLDPVLAEGGIWHAVIRAPDGSIQYSHEAADIVHPASVIKVPLAMATMAWLQKQYPSLAKGLSYGPVGAGRSYDQLLRAALVVSEEDAAQILEQNLIQKVGVKKLTEELTGWGAPETSFVPRRSSAEEMCNVLSALYDRHEPSYEASQLILGWMAAKTSGDSVRLWRLADVLPEGSTIYNKRGSLTDPMIVADAGIIEIPQKGAYKICIFGYPDGKTTFEDLDRIIGDFALEWYAHLP
jgi:hypothetical protein